MRQKRIGDSAIFMGFMVRYRLVCCFPSPRPVDFWILPWMPWLSVLDDFSQGNEIPKLFGSPKLFPSFWFPEKKI
jgi:hypothetical protein